MNEAKVVIGALGSQESVTAVFGESFVDVECLVEVDFMAGTAPAMGDLQTWLVRPNAPGEPTSDIVTSFEYTMSAGKVVASAGMNAGYVNSAIRRLEHGCKGVKVYNGFDVAIGNVVLRCRVVPKEVRGCVQAT